MKKYTVSISNERTGYFEELAYKTSAKALHSFFSICATESYRTYQVYYEERLSPGKSFAIRKIQPIPPRELAGHKFIVRPELFTLDKYDDTILATTFLPLQSIPPPKNQCDIDFGHLMIKSDAEIKGDK